MKDIKKYEAMAKLDLPAAESQWLSSSADKLIESFSCIQAVDTDGVKPLVSVLQLGNVLREDTAKKFFTREELLSASPASSEGYFQVPKTIN